MEEEENGEAQRGGGQEDQADVAGYHEVTHHQRHFVLVHPASPVVGRGWWVPTASHAPCSSVHNQRETKVGGEEGGGGRGGDGERSTTLQISPFLLGIGALGV